MNPSVTVSSQLYINPSFTIYLYVSVIFASRSPAPDSHYPREFGLKPHPIVDGLNRASQRPKYQLKPEARERVEREKREITAEKERERLDKERTRMRRIEQDPFRQNVKTKYPQESGLKPHPSNDGLSQMCQRPTHQLKPEARERIEREKRENAEEEERERLETRQCRMRPVELEPSRLNVKR